MFCSDRELLNPNYANTQEQNVATQQAHYGENTKQLVDLFLQWKACANCASTLDMLLKAYLNKHLACSDDMTLLLKFISSLSKLDLIEIQRELDDLIEEKAAINAA